MNDNAHPSENAESDVEGNDELEAVVGVLVEVSDRTDRRMDDSPAPPHTFVKSEIWLRCLFIAMASTVLLLSVVMHSEGKATVYFAGFASAMPEICTSRRLFGVDCPGCGLTRSFIAISRGQLSHAWGFNPAGFVVYLFVAIQIPWHIIQIWRLRSGRRPMESIWVYVLPFVIVACLIVQWIIKLLTM